MLLCGSAVCVVVCLVLKTCIFSEIGETSTKMTVFDLKGHFHIDPPFVNVDDTNKFLSRGKRGGWTDSLEMLAKKKKERTIF